MMIKTKRLILRPWKETDLKLFAELNADPRVMEYFPHPLSVEESNAMAHRMQSKIEEKGWGFWAVAVPDVADFIGFIGLNTVDKSNFPTHFAPAIEIGWRLAFDYWGKGYATEGAKAALAYGFETLNLDEIVSFTAVQNVRSRRIMEKIGMRRDPKDDFDNPKLPEGHSLRKHVLYRINQQEWRQSTYQKSKYVFKPYSNIFPDLFQREKERIAPHLKEALNIEHVGSTAVPGLGGKGIIDIAIAVKKEDMNAASKQLQTLGYEFRPTFSTSDRFYFIIFLPDPEEGSRRYHLHLTYPENSEWKDFIGFRDYLRNHPEELQEYADMKRQAAIEANHDGERYRKLKEPMFQKISTLFNKRS